MTERTICPTCFGVGSYYIDWDKPNEHDSIECHRCKGTGDVEYVDKSGCPAIGVESSPVPESGCCRDQGDQGECGCS